MGENDIFDANGGALEVTLTSEPANDGIFYKEKQPRQVEPGVVPTDTFALILGLCAIFGAFAMPVIAYACGLWGLIRALRNRSTMRTTAALVLCVVGLICGVVCTVVNLIAVFQTFMEALDELSGA